MRIRIPRALRERLRRSRTTRSWDLPGARAPERRSGWIIGLLQIPLRPLLLALTRPHWEGAENIPAHGPIIVCGNHLSPLDALAYGHLLHASGAAPRFLAKESILRIPVLGHILRSTRQIPVLRGSSRSADALAAARAALARGELLLIFPEGTYTRDPELWPMQGRLGAARLALATGAPLLPVACWGTRLLWPVGSPIPHPGPGRRVQMRVGEPMTVAPRPGEDARAAEERITAQLMAAIAELLGTLRGDTPPDVLHDPRRDAHRPEIGQPVPGYRAWKQTP